MTEARPTTSGVLLTSNLFFSSKIVGVVASVGSRVDVLFRVEALADRMARGDVSFVLIDLALPNLDLSNLIRELPEAGRPRVIAFGPHVETELFAAARAAGCDEVLPHSQLNGRLPELLKSLGA